MKKRHTVNLLITKLILTVLVTEVFTMRCNKIPPDLTSPKSQYNDRFVIEIAGNPSTYVPGEKYKITLRGINEQQRFSAFILMVESQNTNRYSREEGDSNVGTLQLLGDTLTTFHERCPNAVTQTNSVLKNDIQVLWVAPPEDSGCVAFKATVVVSKEKWYSEDGALSVILCENALGSENIQPSVLPKCCACHEAKYEVTFEGLWSRNTHPKDFPSNNFLTRFSDIIGATHSVDYNFWNYGDYASNGLRELAEHGSTKSLERELKDKSDHIRTIIKARGISYPNITGRTFAVFRVDDRHHLMSLVSMIHPSPDWIVGVSSLELCQTNCSWVESKILNLYPWDAGTDNGTTYLSDDSPIEPREPITRITSKSPKNSPFYDDTGAEMKPLARLILSRQRLYEKHSCEDNTPDTDPEDIEEYCAVTEWQEWSPCNVHCGKGTKYRQRTYKHRAQDRIKQQAKCKKTLTQRSSCYGAQRECRAEQSTVNAEECELTRWGQWSECSVTCGNGTITRSRRYKSRSAAKWCSQYNTQPHFEENLPCFMPPCEFDESMPPECVDRAWSEWSTCSVSCGKGTKTRRKLGINVEDLYQHARISRSYDEESEEEATEEDICEKVIERVECYNDERPSCDETTTVTEIADTNTINGIDESTDDGPVDCKVSKWSSWSECSVSCGKGTRTKVRTILVHPRNGGRECPEKLRKKQRCRQPCDGVTDQDCVMTKWSVWSPCNYSCGPNSVRQRTRNIKQLPTGNGKECPDRVEYQICDLSVCPDY